MTSLGALHRAARGRLSAAGADNPELDARLLLHAAAGTSDTDLISRAAMDVEGSVVTRLDGLVMRRASGEPVSRILGWKEFWGLSFQVGPAVLVPRPETETIVEAVLDAYAGRHGEPLSVCDLGTGSGALIAALIRSLPTATGTAVDLDPACLDLARRNAERLGVAERITFVEADFEAFEGGPFDIVVSNPPYVTSCEIETLSREVSRHDPRLALDGGADGLHAYRTIAPRLCAMVRAGGFVALEVGAGQAEAVCKLLCEHGLALEPVRCDLSGIERVVCARGVCATHAIASRRASKKALGNSRQSG